MSCAANKLDTLICGSLYDLVHSSTLDGVPTDFRTVPVTLTLDHPEQPVVRIEMQHLAGSQDRSESSGARVRFRLSPEITATMRPGVWQVTVSEGTPGTDLICAGEPKPMSVVLLAGGSLPLGGV